jgi:acyl carrier protein
MNALAPVKTIAERVEAAAHRYLTPKEELDRTKLIWDLDDGIDSLDRIEFVMALEEDFGIEIHDDAIETFNTLGEVIRWLEARV